MNKKRYLVIVGIVVAAVLISILFYTMLANHRPVITSLKADQGTVILPGSCQIVCNATDPDGDKLSYGWSASGGGITGEGATVTWTAPDSVGSYNVTAMVADGHGGVVTKQVTIKVRANKPPTINSLTGDANWTTPSGKVSVTCNATDPDGDELTYVWLTNGGDISGTGAVVKWTAPEVAGEYVVMVVVTDGYGGSTMGGLDIDVSSTEAAANTEAENVKTASLGYFADYGVWPDSSDDLVTSGFLFPTLKAVYTFGTSYGWLLTGTPKAIGGWTGITFEAGVAGVNGHHGKWVKS
jgi:hypothetical protein